MAEIPHRTPVPSHHTILGRPNNNEPEGLLVHLLEIVETLQCELKKQQEDQCAIWNQLHKVTQHYDKRLDEFKAEMALHPSSKPEADSCNANKLQSSVDTEQSVETTFQREDSVKKELSVTTLESTIHSNHPFQNTIWEAVTVTGTGCLTYPTSAFLWVVMVLTFFIQVAYILVGFQVFGNGWFTDKNIAALLKWRIEVGHSIRFADSFGTPLVQNICERDASVTFGAHQLSKRLVAHHYLQGVPHDGVLLCMMSLCLWYLTISTHFQSVAELASGMTQLRATGRTRIRALSSGNFQIVSVSYLRTCCIWLLCGARTALVLSLGWMGTNFIVHTDSLSDLIIKSLALQGVLNADSLMFKAIVPLDASALIKKLEPIPLRRPHRIGGIDFKAIALLIATPIALAIVYTVMVQPRVEQLQQTRNVLCKGRTDFLVSIDALGIPHAALPSKPDSSTLMYQREAIQDAINGVGADNNPFLVA